MTQIKTGLAVARPEYEGEPTYVVSRQLVDGWALVDAAGRQARASRAASRVAEALARALDQRRDETVHEDWIRAAIEDANVVLFDDEVPPAARLSFATSVLVAVISGARMLLAHAGNARCYRLRDGHWSLLTRPHTAVAALDLDERTAFATHHRHIVTRALGIARRAEPEISEHALEAGDLLILVNDALSPWVEERGASKRCEYGERFATFASTVARRGEQHGVEGAVVALEVVG